MTTPSERIADELLERIERLTKERDAAEHEIENLCEELEKARRTAKEERTLRLAAQASNDAWRAKYAPTEAQKAIRPSAPREGLALLQYLKDRAEAFTMADYTSEEILGAVKWAESWRQNALAMEGAVNAMSEKNNHAKFWAARWKHLAWANDQLNRRLMTKREALLTALLEVGFERNEGNEMTCRGCGMAMESEFSGRHGVIYMGNESGKPCPVGVALAGSPEAA